ncbi:hypothetical protein G9A89_019256 [Geosiphon pyriformis]|nr:hypothetical protein G9A89_019256 [Geosiphon pyriformis]
MRSNPSKTITSLLMVIILPCLLINTAHAHFHFQAPPGRGQSESTIDQAPCGGYNVQGPGTRFPLKGLATVLFEDGNGKLDYYYNSDGNITAATLLFKKIGSDVQIAVSNDATEGKQFRTILDLATVNATIGQRGVLQAIFKSNESNTTWYQCADINIVSSAARLVVFGAQNLGFSLIVVVGGIFGTIFPWI